MKKKVLALAIITLSYQGFANAGLIDSVSSIFSTGGGTTNTDSTSAAVASQVQPSSTYVPSSTTATPSTYDPSLTPSINPVQFQSSVTDSNVKAVVEDCLTDNQRNAAEVVEKVKAQAEAKQAILDGMKSQDAADCFKFGGFDLFGLGGFSIDGLYDKLKAKACSVMQQEINVLKNQVAVAVPLPYGMGNVGMRSTGDGSFISQSQGPTVNIADRAANAAGTILNSKISGATNSAIRNTGIGDIRSTANNSTSAINNSVNNTINSMSR